MTVGPLHLIFDGDRDAATFTKKKKSFRRSVVDY